MDRNEEIDKNEFKEIGFFLDYYLINCLKKLVGERARNVSVMLEEDKKIKTVGENNTFLSIRSYGTHDCTDNLRYLQSVLPNTVPDSNLVKTHLVFTRERLPNRFYILKVRFEPQYYTKKVRFCMSKDIVTLVIQYKTPEERKRAQEAKRARQAEETRSSEEPTRT